MELNRTSQIEAFYQRYVHQECKTIDYETFDASVTPSDLLDAAMDLTDQ